MTFVDAESNISRSDLQTMRHAGSDLLDVMHALQQKGRNVLTELLATEGRVQEWGRYPENDVFDPGTGYRYFYHAHPGPNSQREHGHFHLFVKSAGGHARQAAAFTHLLAIAVSPAGLPVRGFTTNRWVTDEVWQPAALVIRKSGQFSVNKPGRLALVHRWLEAMVRLFKPQIAWLLQERDRRWQAAIATRPNLFEDRRTTLMSEHVFSLARQFALLERATPALR